MKKFTLTDLFMAIIWLMPIVYLITIYSKLPPTVPVHFGMDGKPNGYGTPGTVILFQAIMSGVTLGTFFLMRYLPQIDPKKLAQYGEDNFRKFSYILVVFLSAISIMALYSMLQGELKFDNLLLVAISLFFAFMGNLMYNVKPNYFVGIRTPWTLENEDNWKATHRLAGKLWVPGGIIMALLMLILQGEIRFTVFIAATVILCVIPMVYSYRYFKNNPTQPPLKGRSE